MPVLLTTREALDQLIGRLEIHYLASQVGDLQFALLSDWTDAPSETSRRRRGIHAGRALRDSFAGTGLRREATVSCCCTADAYGMRANADGSDGNASAVSCAS